MKAVVSLRFRRYLASVLLALLVSSFAIAQTATQMPPLQPRITAPIDNSSRATLTGSQSPRANPANDIGPVSPSMKLQGISLVFSRSAAQQTALNTLLAAQQNPASPLYHQWLTPEQFAARFGVADADISAVESWLEQQGFSIDSVSRSRNRIFFSGSAAQVASAFGAPLHNYRTPASGSQPASTNFAPSADLTIPSALASSVLAIGNISSFRPHSHVTLQPSRMRPQYTVQGTQAYFLTPPDLETIYDVNPAIGQGLNGSGQTIAIVGQSAVTTTDITNFQTLIGLPAKAPGTILVPNTGTSTFVAGDETEADVDLEYSSALAPGATVNFYYTGSDTNFGVFDALQYVVDNDLAPIVSISFGSCEFVLGALNMASFDSTVLMQAAAQGETVVASSGDTGSTGCEYDSLLDTEALTALAVSYPASSPYVTAIGGTEFPAADVTPPNTTFWASAPNGDVVSTALSYIPEQVWNDDAFLTANLGGPVISAGGGGISLFEPLPAWQTGVPGIPSGATNRLVPDISLAASPEFPGYLYCSSDSSGFAAGQTASCPGGFFYQVVNGKLAYNIAGGTSFDAPTFAGMLAIINQAKGYTTGQGNINPTLYTLASSPMTYASAFHDITSGGNQCLAGPDACQTGPQATDYVSGIGYDEASGLGSIDFDNLLMAWPVSTGSASLIDSSTTLTATTLTPANGAFDTINIVVASDSAAGTFVPFGSVSVSVNGTVVNGDLALTNGTATYTFSSTTAGSAIVSVTYSGDSNYSSSTGTVTLTVGSITPGSFALAAANATTAPGAATTGTITITPANGYTGTVNLAVSGSITNGCVSISPASVAVTAGTSAVTASYTIDTTSTACASGAAVVTGKSKKVASLNPASHQPKSPWKQLPIPPALAGTVLLVCFRRRSRLLRAAMALGFLLVLSFSGLGLTGCSSGSSASTTPPPTDNTPAGTYTFTVTGTDSNSSTITASNTFTITVS